MGESAIVDSLFARRCAARCAPGGGGCLFHRREIIGPKAEGNSETRGPSIDGSEIAVLIRDHGVIREAGGKVSELPDMSARSDKEPVPEAKRPAAEKAQRRIAAL